MAKKKTSKTKRQAKPKRKTPKAGTPEGGAWEPKGVPGEPGWEPAPGVRLRKALRGHTHYIGRIAWSPDGKWLASPSYDRTIRIWDGETGRWRAC